LLAINVFGPSQHGVV